MGRMKTKSIFIWIILFLILISFVFYFYRDIKKISGAFKEDSHNTIVKELESHNKKYKAIAFIRDNGATTDFSPQVSILNSRDKLGDEGGNVFIGYHSKGVDIQWEDDTTLIVTYDCEDKDILKKSEEIYGVKVKYEKVKADSPNKTSTAQENSKDNNLEDKTKINLIQENNEPKEIFFGRWVINKQLAAYPVQTLTNDDINSIMGKKVEFSKGKSISFREKVSDLNNIISNPTYKKKIVAKDEFESGSKYRVTFEKLGIKGDSITEIDVIDSKQDTSCTFYIKDNNTLILSGGGVFFQLDRN